MKLSLLGQEVRDVGEQLERGTGVFVLGEALGEEPEASVRDVVEHVHARWREQSHVLEGEEVQADSSQFGRKTRVGEGEEGERRHSVGAPGARSGSPEPANHAIARDLDTAPS